MLFITANTYHRLVYLKYTIVSAAQGLNYDHEQDSVYTSEIYSITVTALKLSLDISQVSLFHTDRRNTSHKRMLTAY